jgi:DNA-binding NarL/FixJ family response regulator
LLADDYTELMGAFERLLAPTCDVVGCVADGDAVFEAIPRLQPDVVVLDLHMPPTDGIEICRHVKEIAPETAVIILSASSDVEIIREALRAGASAFVTKVAAVDALLPAIQRAMAARSVADS